MNASTSLVAFSLTILTAVVALAQTPANGPATPGTGQTNPPVTTTPPTPTASAQAPAPVEDKCLPQGSVSRLLNSYHWKMQMKDGSNKTLPAFDRCNPELLSSMTMKAILAIDQMPMLTRTPSPLELGTLGPSATQFFRAHISTIVLNRDDTDGCDDHITAAFVRTGEGHVMHICPSSAFSGQLYLMATLIHEARHVDGYPHVLCDAGRFAGTQFYGCDPTYKYRGAYEIETELMFRMLHTPKIPDATKLEARADIFANLENSFNEEPLELRQGVFLEDVAHHLSFYNGQTLEPVIDTPATGLFIDRVGSPTWYQAEQGEVLSYTNTPALTPTAGVYAQGFRASEAAKRGDLKDVFHARIPVLYSCQLWTTEMTCTGADNSNFTVSLSVIRPVKFLLQEDRLGIIGEDGFVYQLPNTPEELRKKIETDFVKTTNTLRLQFASAWVAPWNLGIDEQNQLVRFRNGARSTETFQSAKGLKFRGMTMRTWWSKKMETL